MAGILGILGNGSGNVAEVFPKMLTQAQMYPWYETVQCVCAGGNGNAGGDGFFASCGLAGIGECVERDGQILAFYGEIFNAPGSPAEFLLHGLLERGKSFLADVNGRYQAAMWDVRSRKLTLFTDIFATRPLYWTQTAGGVLFAPQMKTLLCESAVSRNLNREALVDFFTWGHYLHTYTSLEGIEVLPPAAFYTWDAESGELTKERYFSFSAGVETGCCRAGDCVSENWASGNSMPSTVDEVAERFRESVLMQTGFASELGIASGIVPDLTGLGISLSGGLDARSILGMIPPKLQENMTSVALGIPGSADHVLATQLAEKVSTHHFNYELNTDFLQNYDEAFSEMIRLTDGQYLSSSIVIPTLNFYREKGIKTLLRGHAGELFHMSKAYAFSMTEADRTAMENGTLSPKIWAFLHLQAYMLDGVKTDLLLGLPRSECVEMARASLYRALEETGEERENVVWKLYLSQRVFREIPLSMRKFDSHVNVRLPFLDRGVAEAVFRLPSSLRMGETIQRRILKRWRTDFLRVRNVNTGTYIGAWGFQQKIANLRQRVLAKLNVQGYQPYERMGLWLRRELKPYVRELLLDGLRSRGIFHPDTITEVVRTHNEGKNHTYLILALMILEKQMRFWED
ncbi:MAG: asparagine synthase-related protein [Planctomycetia bacterium]|nr:asparagine synthase-related protein [Planctomycetia bacterium]